MRRSWIGEHHGDARIEWQPDHVILIAVVNSARTRLAKVLDGWRERGYAAVLVVDECHRAGSEYNSRIFEGHYDYALGLSATPERDDRGHEQYVYPGLGRPVYRYSLLDALDDGVLAPVLSVNLYVDFDPGERVLWSELSEDIGTAFRNLMYRYPELEYVPDEMLLREVAKLAEGEDPLAMKILKLLADRRQLLSSARARLACQGSILEWLAQSRRRALVFHETISTAEASHRALKDLQVPAGLDHSGLHRTARSDAMDRFRNNRAQVLVAVRALDEGVDVPDASVAVIAAGSRSRRQRIQRFGRVLRPGEGKQALVLTILVRGTPEEAAVGARDASLLGEGRVRHHRWPGTPVNVAIGAPASSYRPDAPEYSVEDLLTLLELGLWEPGKAVVRRARPAGVGGGYGTKETEFSANGWYRVDDVRDGIGMPQAEFDQSRQHIRRTFRRSLDQEKAKDMSLIHGSEIEAVRRDWHRRERNRLNLGRRR